MNESQDTPGVQDTLGEEAQIGGVQSAPEKTGEPQTKGIETLTDEELEGLTTAQIRAMRNDYLRKVQEVAAIKEREKTEEQQEEPDGKEADPANLPPIGGGSLFQQVRLPLDEGTFRSQEGQALFQAVKVLESIVERHMILSEPLFKKVDGIVRQQQTAAKSEVATVTTEAGNMVAKQYGINPSAKDIHEAVRLFGAGLLKVEGKTRMTAEIAFKAWQMANPNAVAVKRRGTVPSIGTAQPNHASRLAGVANGREMTTDELILADLEEGHRQLMKPQR